MKLQIESRGTDLTERPTMRAPYDSSPALAGLVDYASEVRIRAAVRADKVATRRRGR